MEMSVTERCIDLYGDKSDESIASCRYRPFVYVESPWVAAHPSCVRKPGSDHGCARNPEASWVAGNILKPMPSILNDDGGSSPVIDSDAQVTHNSCHRSMRWRLLETAG
eukprot:s996_g3.t1